MHYIQKGCLRLPQQLFGGTDRGVREECRRPRTRIPARLTDPTRISLSTILPFAPESATAGGRLVVDVSAFRACFVLPLANWLGAFPTTLRKCRFPLVLARRNRPPPHPKSRPSPLPLVRATTPGLDRCSPKSGAVCPA